MKSHKKVATINIALNLHNLNTHARIVQRRGFESQLSCQLGALILFRIIHVGCPNINCVNVTQAKQVKITYSFELSKFNKMYMIHGFGLP